MAVSRVYEGGDGLVAAVAPGPELDNQVQIQI